MKLPKYFPKFQTVSWWIRELAQWNPDAIVVIATSPYEVRALASIYPSEKNLDCEEDKLKTKKLIIDVE